MCSKVIASILAVATIGCARETERLSTPIEVHLKGSSDCLANIAPTASAYAKGELDRAEIEAFWGCAIGAVDDYQALTVGTGPNGAYTPQALRHFFERYFIKSQPVSDALLVSLMELKRVFLAGNTEQISVAEIRRLRELLQLLRDLSLDLQPVADVLFAQKADVGDIELQEANGKFRAALERLIVWLEKSDQPYSFAQLGDLIRGARSWWPSSDRKTQSLFDVMEQGLVILPRAKHILVAGDPGGIGGSEWRPVLNSLMRAYGIFLNTHYAFRKNLDAGLVRDAVPDAMATFVEILDAAVKARPQAVVPINEWMDLFARIAQTGWLPPAFDAGSLNAAWTWFLNRLLGGGAEQGLTAGHVRKLQAQVQIWKNLLSYARGGMDLRSPDVRLFESVRDASVPLTWDMQGRMIFPSQAPEKWTSEAQAHLVWPYVILNWIKSSYADDSTTALTADQVSLVTSEVLPLLQGFGWLKATRPSIGLRILREADLFTLASNGDGQLDLSEAVRYLALVMSSYRSAQVWLDAAQGAACIRLDAMCVRVLPLQEGRAELLSPFPRLQAQLQIKSGSDKLTPYLEQAEGTILGHTVVGAYSTGDLLQVWMLLQYVEAFLQRYDSNLSDTINLYEANQAYTIFGRTLGELLRPTGIPSDQVYAFFTFMMKFGDTPFSMFGGQVAYDYWLWHQNKWSFEAGRANLMSILYQLSHLEKSAL